MVQATKAMHAGHLTSCKGSKRAQTGATVAGLGALALPLRCTSHVSAAAANMGREPGPRGAAPTRPDTQGVYTYTPGVYLLW